MIPKSFIDYYGDQTRWFLGEVVNIKDDPLKIGRARVRIFGVYDEIDEKDLPWAQIVVPVTHAVNEKLGQVTGLLVGTQVFGIFLDGQSSQLPLIVGSIPTEGDDNKKAEENYPYNKVYETESGHYKEYDDTEGNTRIREQHASGTYTEMEHDGSMRTEVQKDQYIRVKGDVKIIGDKDANVTIEGNCNITVTGDATISAKNVSVTGTDAVTVRAGNKVVLG